MFSFISKRAIFIVLFAAFLFIGCQQEEEPDFFTLYLLSKNTLNENLIGTWISEYDGYTITKTGLSYNDGFGGGYAGTIEYVSNFSNNAGVIIIKYYPEHRPTYYDNFENWGDPDHILPLKGDYIGIYYKNLKPGTSIQIGGAYEDKGAEKNSLDAAKNAFTQGNEGTYMSYYGIYTRQ
jgi:hypothetical protein